MSSKAQSNKNAEEEQKTVFTIEETVSHRRVKELLCSNILSVVKYTDDFRNGEVFKTANEWLENDFTFLMDHFENKKGIKRYYKPSNKKDNEGKFKDIEGNRRLYGGHCLQFISRQIRGYLLQDDFIDIDMVNSMPTILLKFMQEDDEKCEALKEYCNNRKSYLEKYGANFKQVVISQINDTKLYEGKDEFQAKLFKEIHRYRRICEEPLTEKLHKEERRVCDQMVKIAKKKGFNINAIVFDGIVVNKPLNDKGEKDVQKVSNFLEEMNKVLAPYKFIEKAWELPSIKLMTMNKFDYFEDATYSDLLNNTGQHYETLNSCYCDLLPLFLRTVRIVNGFYVLKNSLSIINPSYKIEKEISRNIFRVTYGDKKRPFTINDLVTKFGSLIRYEHLTFNRYSIKNKEFSLDTPFLCENVKLPEDWEERTKMFKEHILIVNADGNEKLANGFYWFYANLLQTDEKSGSIVITTGRQGSGKSIIPEEIIINRILGNKGKIVNTLNDITDRFNSSLYGRRFVLIQELSNIDSDTKKYDESILKGIITSTSYDIEKKGVDKLTVSNHIEFMGCSNFNNCISQVDGVERRNVITKSSSEKVGDKKYFDELVKYINDPLNIRSIYEFLIRFDISDRHYLENMPKTESKIEGIYRSLNNAVKSALFFLESENDEKKIEASDIFDNMKEYRLNYGENYKRKTMVDNLKNYFKYTNPQNRLHFNVSLKALNLPTELFNYIQTQKAEIEQIIFDETGQTIGQKVCHLDNFKQ